MVLMLSADRATSKPRILFFGDSLTAGYGVGKNHAYPALIRSRIEKSGMKYEGVNGGLSGETTAGGLRRLGWMLKKEIVILVIALGGNDGLRGISTESTAYNLEMMIDQARRRYPKIQIVLAGTQIPPNLGKDFTGRFEAIFPRVAKRKNVALIPFLLKGVGGNPKLNLTDQIHPNRDGHKILAENVWKVLRPLL